MDIHESSPVSSLEDDISILEIPSHTNLPSSGSNQIPEFEIITGASADVHGASHFALSFAYKSLQSRHAELEQKHSQLIKQYKQQLQPSGGSEESQTTGEMSRSSLGRHGDDPLRRSHGQLIGRGPTPTRDNMDNGLDLGLEVPSSNHGNPVNSYGNVPPNSNVGDTSIAMQEEFITFLQSQLDGEQLKTRDCVSRLEEERNQWREKERSLETQLKSMETEHTSVVKNLDKERKNLKAHAAKLEEENKASLKSITELTSNNKTLEEDKKKTQTRMSEVWAENQDLKNDLSIVRKRSDDSQKKQWDYEELFNRVNVEKERLNQELYSMKRAKNDLEKQLKASEQTNSLVLAEVDRVTDASQTAVKQTKANISDDIQNTDTDNETELVSLVADVKQQKVHTDALGQVVRQQKAIIQQLIPQMLHLAHRANTDIKPETGSSATSRTSHTQVGGVRPKEYPRPTQPPAPITCDEDPKTVEPNDWLGMNMDVFGPPGQRHSSPAIGQDALEKQRSLEAKRRTPSEGWKDPELHGNQGGRGPGSEAASKKELQDWLSGSGVFQLSQTVRLPPQNNLDPAVRAPPSRGRYSDPDFLSSPMVTPPARGSYTAPLSEPRDTNIRTNYGTSQGSPRPINIERNVDEDWPILERKINVDPNINTTGRDGKEANADEEAFPILNNHPLAGRKSIPARNIYAGDQPMGSPVDQRPAPPVEQSDSIERLCPICNQEFPSDMSQMDFEEHVFQCLGSPDAEEMTMIHPADPDPVVEKVCPVCNNIFPPAFAQEDFELHVDGHFRNDNFEIVP